MRVTTEQPSSAISRSDDGRIAARIVAIARELAVELHPHLRRTLSAHIDSDLDRDLGLDSLGRAELLHRLDRTFKVKLPDATIGDASSIRDLLVAVLSAAPDAGSHLGQGTLEPTILPAVEAPSEATTLLEVLARHVRDRGARPHIRLWHGEAGEETITYAGLDRAARCVARGIIERGLRVGERVAIMLPTQADFFSAFFGILYAGGVPVPIYPPFRKAQIEDHLRRQAGILRNAQARILITAPEIRQVAALLLGLAEDLQSLQTVAELSANGPIPDPLPSSSQTVALIQYTSGSTGDPKGVVLTHANLLANIRAMGEALEAGSGDAFVSWLPLYHDMGLIGAWLACLYYAAPTVIMPPLAFLADPARWLWAIHRHRATLSAAPNFAFELCLKNVRDEDIKGLDLSSLRMVVNGAEPVSPSTIARFTERFQRYGLRPEAVAPVYGLAECSVGLAFPPPGRRAIVDRVDRDAMARIGVATPVKPNGAAVLEFVACGQPIPRHEVRIVDNAGFELPERHEGRLQFKGPSATRGYFRNEEKTRALFDGEWLESGDRAYIAAGDIYITGRIKDMIIRAGRNIYPHELEELIGGIEGVRKGCVAVVAASDAQQATERLVVIAETRLTEEADLEQLRQRIMEAATDVYELPPDEVALVPPHTVPKTSSGKIRRSAARELFEAGSLTRRGRALWWQLARLTLMGAAHRLRRGARILGGFAYAGWWGSALIMTAIPTWLLVMMLPRRSSRHAVVHRAARGFLWLTGTPLTIERAPGMILPERSAIFVVNHASYLDAAIVAAALPGALTFIAKSELADQLVAGPFLRRVGVIFVRRFDARGGVEDTQVQLDAARSGGRLISFPEGTFTRMPGLLGFRLGAFLVAAETGIPVVPVTLRGTRHVLRGGQWFPRRGEIHVHIGTPVRADGPDFDAAVRLRDAIRKEMLKHCGEPDLVREVVELQPVSVATAPH